jgi:NCS1 family nucleobase:cation symporter-1
MRWFPHTPSQLEHPNTGEDVIAAFDEKQIQAGHRKPQKGLRDLLRSARHRQSSV